MIRAVGIAALAVSFFSAPVAAQDDGGLRGVWQGTVGDQAVHVCFGGGDDRGVYYYDTDRELVRLLNEEGDFFEAPPWGDATDTVWNFRQITAEAAAGEWSDGARTLPVQLTRLAWTALDEYAGPCESAAFNEPRFEGGSITGRPGELGGAEYIIMTYVPPRQWQAQQDGGTAAVTISTFMITDNARDTWGNNRAINRHLTANLPAGDMTDQHAQCFAQNIATHGTDGDFTQEIVPELITARWVGAIESTGVYCGGAHPSYWQIRRVFDRNTGDKVDPESWLNDAGLNRELVEAGKDTFVYTTLTQPLIDAVVAYFPDANEGGVECAAIAAGTSRWQIGLQAEGLAFIPSVPHVYSPCAETVVLPWADAEPFLSVEGRAVMLSLAE